MQPWKCWLLEIIKMGNFQGPTVLVSVHEAFVKKVYTNLKPKKIDGAVAWQWCLHVCLSLQYLAIQHAEMTGLLDVVLGIPDIS